jgi:hypothetical protein
MRESGRRRLPRVKNLPGRVRLVRVLRSPDHAGLQGSSIHAGYVQGAWNKIWFSIGSGTGGDVARPFGAAGIARRGTVSTLTNSSLH